MNEVLRVIRDRRSIRRFTRADVSDSELTAIREAERWALSGENTQPRQFVAVRSVGKYATLARVAPQNRMIEIASVTIVVLYNCRSGYDRVKDLQSVRAATENTLLAAHSLGLAACWLRKVRGPEIERFLEDDSDEELVALTQSDVLAKPCSATSP